MNELNPPLAPQKKNNTAKYVLIALLAVAAVGALGYFASQAGLDKALVKREVDAWIERSKQHAALEGYDLAIVYDDVSIRGGLTDGHALITNMKIISKPVGGVAGDESVTFTTAEVKIDPNSADLSDLDVILPTPLHVFEGKNSFETASLIAEEPLEFTVEQLEQDKKHYNRISHTLPAKLTLRTLAGQDAVGEEDKEQQLTPRYDVVELSMEGKGQVTTNTARSDLGNSEIEVKNLSIVPVGNEIGAVKVDRLYSAWKNTLNDKQLNMIDAEFAIDNLTADKKFLPYAPINASIKGHFEGPMPATPEEFASIRTQQASFKLSEFIFKTKDASLNATADFVASGEDILPIGKANINVTNVPEWRELLKKNDVIGSKDEQVINTLFIRIAGVTLPDAKDVTVDIKRAREGSFQIGQITFEELLAILLRGVETPLDTQIPSVPPEAVKGVEDGKEKISE